MIHILIPSQRSGGVFDFSCKLLEALGEHSGRLVYLSKENATDWSVGPADTVILQMSGYGFEKRGVPLWLVQELKKRRRHMKALGIYFHELYAFGAPWSSSFWLSPIQRLIARRLVEMSDFWMTNRDGSAQWLERFSGDKPHAVLPVFSNVGELKALPQLRSPKLIVFGSAALRQLTYQAAGAKLFALARSASLEIHDIGAPITDRHLADKLNTSGVVLRGRLDVKEVSRAMADAMFGLLAYPVEYVAKSGIFAAYCAHGVCPILMSESYLRTDRLVAGRQYLPGFADREITIEGANAVGRAAYEWYQPHKLQRHSDEIHSFLRDLEGF